MSAHRSVDVAVPTADTPASDTGTTDLLALAISQPAEAVTTARRMLATPTGETGAGDPHADSVAHHAIAIVERDRGRTATAIAEARAALRSARRAGPDREAEVRATLGTTLLFAGRTKDALHQLDRALELTGGDARHRVLHLRGCTFWLIGRYDDALDDLGRAVTLSRRAGDRLWEGRALGSRGDVRRAMGDVAGSELDYAEAERVHLSIGEVVEATLSARNRAIVALQRGDVVSALARMDQAEERFRQAGIDPVEQLVDHAEALLTARLGDEAQQLLDTALVRTDLAPVWRADLLLESARASLLREHWQDAWERARQAQRLFASHRRLRWAARSELFSLEAAYAMARGTTRDPALRGIPQETTDATGRDGRPPTGEDLFRQVRRVVAHLRRLADPDLPAALLLLAQVATDTGHDRTAARALEEAARRRSSGAPLPRAAAWLAAALLASGRGDRRGLRHACRRGLDAVDEHRSVIGDLELRALATGYGFELASLAVRDAVDRHDARGLLWWTERWRATTLAGPGPGVPDDPELVRDVAALRDVTRRLAAPDAEAHLARERDRLESSVRRRYRRVRADDPGRTGPDLAALLAALDDTVLLSLTLVRGRVHAVTVADGRVTHRVLGDLQDALREVGFARFALRRAAVGRHVDVDRAGARLQRALLGDDPDPRWSRPKVLVVPAAGLLTVPFGLLPVLRRSAVTVAPSTTPWLRSRGRAPGTGHVALVTGPGLSTEQQEVGTLRQLHRDAVVLGGDTATVHRTLAVLDGARLAHVAAHGTFRADAPLFSSLMLADGPLMVHDLDRLRRPPEAVVLSACDSGGVHPIGADEALGLVSSLLAVGTRSIVASVDPVNDWVTRSVMTDLHRAVAAGSTLAEGLRVARESAGDDPLAVATAAAFNAWGA